MSDLHHERYSLYHSFLDFASRILAGRHQEAKGTLLALAWGMIVLSCLASHPFWVKLWRRTRFPASRAFLTCGIFYRCFANANPSLSLLRHGLKLLDQIATAISSLGASTVPLSLLAKVQIIAEDGMAVVLVVSLFRVYTTNLRHLSWKSSLQSAINSLFDSLLQHIPTVKKKIDEEIQSLRDSADEWLRRHPYRRQTLQLAKKGRSCQDILNELKLCQEQEEKISGKLSGTKYNNIVEILELQAQAFRLFVYANPLHAGIWPKVQQCEAEVIAMVGHMLHAPSSIGALTLGGTDSIIHAIRAHLGYYGTRRHILYPELVCGSTAHASVDKACEMFGIRKVVVDCSLNAFQLSAAKVRSKVTVNTIMIFASAPCYPQGAVDPIEELSDIAQAFDVGLHVDACLGGFLLPFVPQAPLFDFEVPGVTSMSVDTHKYGLATKGSSVVLYRHSDLRRCQYYCVSKWAGGLYVTPTVAGSRPGALAACAWASMIAMGRDGYKRQAHDVVSAARLIAKGVGQMKGLRLLTPQVYNVVCVGSSDTTLNIYSIADQMKKRGQWHLSSLQSPACFHLCVTLCVAPYAGDFLRDLQASIDYVRSHDKEKAGGQAAVYGTVTKLPAAPIDQILCAYTDITLEP